jgi:hypothetical protein
MQRPAAILTMPNMQQRRPLSEGERRQLADNDLSERALCASSSKKKSPESHRDASETLHLLTAARDPEYHLPQCSDLAAIGEATDIAPTSLKRPD